MALARAGYRDRSSKATARRTMRRAFAVIDAQSRRRYVAVRPADDAALTSR
jgi:hypothetical protein